MRHVRDRRWSIVSAAVFSVMLSACAQTQHAYQPQSYAGAYSEPGQVAVATPPRIYLEDDGMPAQQPPRFRRGAAPDDPSEPFSPNYGPPPRNAPVKPRVKEAHATYVPRKPIDADLIIAQAITAHELRSQ